MSSISFGSVCSGIEAASVAWEPLGWRAKWLAEIEAFPSEVLAHRYPQLDNLGDMTKLPDMVASGDIAAPDVIVGGTPCQSFSVAGLRAGLSDERGQLTIKYVELADAIDNIRQRAGKDESIIVWENVPGVLSAKDNAFGCFLGALAGEDCELKPSGKRWANAGYVLGPKRAIAWRILDAQYFGLAQRRRRVFVVASARAGFCPAKVLFEFDGLRRDFAPSREAGQETTGNVGAGFTPSSFGGYREGVGALRAAGGDLGGGSETLSAAHCHAVAIGAFKAGQGAAAGGIGFSEYLSPTLTSAESGSNRTPALLYETAVRRLTPIECERLQGFPDGYTAIPWRNKPAEQCPDGHRYKALGNSMAVPVMRWIGRRIELEITKGATA